MRSWFLIAVFFLISPTLAAEPSVLLSAVADVMLSRNVPERINAHGPDWAWEDIIPYLKKADLRFCNLECPVSTKGRAIPKKYSFRADPEMALQVFKAGDINIASLANNHTYDYGSDPLKDTWDTLEKAGITAPGAGIGRAGAIAPRIVTSNGLKLAFVAYTWWTPEGYLPGDDLPSLATLDESTLAAELKAAKAGADLLIMSIHWGKEYSPGFSPGQQRIAHLAIDAGADLIIGHHPHVAQPVEIYHDRPILYSLGNCIFDRTGQNVSNGMLALVRLTKERVTVEKTVPFSIEEARPVLRKIDR